MNKRNPSIGDSDRLGSYQIEEFIKSGGMSKVYVAIDTETGQNVRRAIKILDSEQQRNPSAIKRFMEEAELAADLDHKHILNAWGARRDKETGLYYLPMQLARGFSFAGRRIRSLGDLVEVRYPKPRTGSSIKGENQIPIGEEQAIHYLNQALLGIAHAHDNGLVHRDIKPSNLLLADENTLKVADFGIASQTNTPGEETALTQTSPDFDDPTQIRLFSAAGSYTRDYASPEQLDGRETTHHTDIYSLGLVLHALLFGNVHIEHGTPLSKRRNDLSPEWDDWFQTAVKVNPSDRFSNAEEARKALPQSRDKALLGPILNRYDKDLKAFRFLFRQDQDSLRLVRQRIAPFSIDHAATFQAILEGATEELKVWETSLNDYAGQPPEHCWSDLTTTVLAANCEETRSSFRDRLQDLERLLAPLEAERTSSEKRLHEQQTLWKKIRKDADTQQQSLETWIAQKIEIEGPESTAILSPEQVCDSLTDGSWKAIHKADSHIRNLITQGEALASEPENTDLESWLNVSSEAQVALEQQRQNLKLLAQTWEQAERRARSISDLRPDYISAKKKLEKQKSEIEDLKERAVQRRAESSPGGCDNLVKMAQLIDDSLASFEAAVSDVASFQTNRLKQSVEYTELVRTLFVAQHEVDTRKSQLLATIKDPESEVSESFGTLPSQTQSQRILNALLPVGSLVLVVAFVSWYVFSERLWQGPEQRALWFRERGDLNRAYGLYAEKLDQIKSPTNSVAESQLLTSMAEVRFEQARWFDAVGLCKKALTEDESNSSAGALFAFLQWEINGRGGDGMKETRKDVVFPALNKALEVDDRNPEAAGFRALLQMQSTRSRSEVRRVHGELDKIPVDLERPYAWVYHLADSYGHWRLGHPAQMREAASLCEQNFDRFASRRGTPLTIQVFRAYLNLFVEDYSEAISQSRDAISRMEEFIDNQPQYKHCLAFALKVHGDANAAIGNLDQAKESLKRATLVDSDYVLAFVNYTSERLWGDPEERRRAIRRGMDLDPSCDFLLLNWANSHQGENRIEILSSALKDTNFQNHPEILRELASTRYQLNGGYTESDETHLQNAINRHPYSYYPKTMLAAYLAEADRFEEAFLQLKEAIDTDPLLPTAYLLGMEWSQNNDDSQKALEFLELGRANGGIDESEPATQRRIGFAFINGWHPELETKESNYSEAFHWFEKAAESGDSISCIVVGHYYAPWTGDWAKPYQAVGKGPDLQKAIESYGNAFLRGHAQGARFLGESYRVGWHPESSRGASDHAAAFPWYKKASEAGDGYSTRVLAHYFSGWTDEWAKPYLEAGIEEDWAKAIDLYRVAYELGDAEGALRIALAYQYGWNPNVKNDEIDYKTAFTWFAKAADADLPDASRNIRFLYTQHHLGATRNLDEALQWLISEAENGHVESMRQLGYLYRDGGVDQNAVPPDPPKSFDWFRRAAEKGSAGAMASYGEFFRPTDTLPSPWKTRYRLATSEDAHQAVHWYMKAQALDNAFAMLQLGYANLNGWHPKLENSTKDYAEALHWFQEAANRGNADALREVGNFYSPEKWASSRNAVVGGADPLRAISFYEDASRMGDGGASGNIAVALRHGWHPGNGLDLAEAVKWLELGAKQRNAFCLRELGNYYAPIESAFYQVRNAVVGGVNANKAEQLYEQAAEKGDVWAIENLRRMNALSSAEAISRLQKLAKEENRDAMHLIGSAFREGWHPEGENYQEAFEWFQRGADADDKDSMTALGDFYRPRDDSHTRQPKYRAVVRTTDPDEAIKWYQAAANKGESYAMEMIAAAFRKGWHPQAGDSDFKQAFQFYLEAATSGNVSAMTWVAAYYNPESYDSPKSNYAEAGFEPDPVQALMWYTRAAKLGDGFSKRRIAFAYQVGWHPEANGHPDYRGALPYFEEASKAGDSIATRELAEYYYPWQSMEEGKAKNLVIGSPIPEKAEAIYGKAAELGDSRSFYRLGTFHLNGNGDPGKAFGYFESAAKLGDSDAMVELGHYFRPDKDEDWELDYKDVVPESAVDATNWYQRAAESGSRTAARYMGWSFYKGWHPDATSKPDCSGAYKWFQSAAEAGDLNAMCQLGHFYRPRDEEWEQDYEGIQNVDPVEALFWYEKAANMGYGHGCRRVGEAYLEGWHPDGVNLSKARKWLQKAVELRDVKAVALLDGMPQS